jgi:hypothetical protein
MHALSSAIVTDANAGLIYVSQICGTRDAVMIFLKDTAIGLFFHLK